jgi:hypothetical protein
LRPLSVVASIITIVGFITGAHSLPRLISPGSISLVGGGIPHFLSIPIALIGLLAIKVAYFFIVYRILQVRTIMSQVISFFLLCFQFWDCLSYGFMRGVFLESISGNILLYLGKHWLAKATRSKLAVQVVHYLCFLFWQRQWVISFTQLSPMALGDDRFERKSLCFEGERASSLSEVLSHDPCFAFPTSAGSA